jgi:hypothetical protein
LVKRVMGFSNSSYISSQPLGTESGWFVLQQQRRGKLFSYLGGRETRRDFESS